MLLSMMVLPSFWLLETEAAPGDEAGWKGGTFVKRESNIPKEASKIMAPTIKAIILAVSSIVFSPGVNLWAGEQFIELSDCWK